MVIVVAIICVVYNRTQQTEPSEESSLNFSLKLRYLIYTQGMKYEMIFLNSFWPRLSHLARLSFIYIYYCKNIIV